MELFGGLNHFVGAWWILRGEILGCRRKLFEIYCDENCQGLIVAGVWSEFMEFMEFMDSL